MTKHSDAAPERKESDFTKEVYIAKASDAAGSDGMSDIRNWILCSIHWSHPTLPEIDRACIHKFDRKSEQFLLWYSYKGFGQTEWVTAEQILAQNPGLKFIDETKGQEQPVDLHRIEHTQFDTRTGLATFVEGAQQLLEDEKGGA